MLDLRVSQQKMGCLKAEGTFLIGILFLTYL